MGKCELAIMVFVVTTKVRPQFLQKKTLFFTHKAILNDWLGRTVWAGGFGCRFFILDHNSNSIQQRGNFIFGKPADMAHK